MPNPQRWRTIGLAFCISGVAALVAASQWAGASDTVRSLLAAYGLSGLVFGGGTAVLRHLDARAKDSLARGEDVIARWRVDSETWRAFAAHNDQLDQEKGAQLNELSIREEVPDEGVEVIVGKTAVQIDGSIHTLPRRGTPEITHAELNTSRVRPSFIELRLYYPGGGRGASGVPHPPTRTTLRFPVAPSALHDAATVVAYYGGAQPGSADFFHGRGDGSDPEDLSKCYSCGYETHRYLSHCPQCGLGLQSRRWSRRFGLALFVCGLFITSVVAAVLYNTAALLLHPGVPIDGTHFSGTAPQGLFLLGILGAVFTFGAVITSYGIWQARSGRRDGRVIYLVVGLAAALWLITKWMTR